MVPSGFFSFPRSGRAPVCSRRRVHRGGFAPALALLVSLALSSCIGTDSRITVNKDGSGAIKVEYRLAGDLESLGKLDGNERWLPLPAGKADLERTADRIEGLKLLSASQKTKGKDSVLGAEFSFASPEALNAFFDASGQAFTADIPGRRMVLVFPESGDQNPDFKALLSAALEGYGFSLAFSLPGAARVAWFDGEGGAAPSFPGNCAVQGSTVEYSVPMAELVFLDRTLTMEISW